MILKLNNMSRLPIKDVFQMKKMLAEYMIIKSIKKINLKLQVFTLKRGLYFAILTQPHLRIQMPQVFLIVEQQDSHIL